MWKARQKVVLYKAEADFLTYSFNIAKKIPNTVQWSVV